MRSSLSFITGASLIVLHGAAIAQEADDLSNSDLATLSIEELAQLEVKSASKRPEPLSLAPASLYVITG